MNRLNSMENYERIDSDNMYDKIINLPAQIKSAYENSKLRVAENIKLEKYKTVERVIICGMGGSAISGDILNSAFSGILNFKVVKDYHLPKIRKKDLIIAISYSGNTAETNSMLEYAIGKTDFIAAITTGGKIREQVKDKYPWVKLEPGFPPRSAIGFLFFAAIKMLEKFGLIPAQKDIIKATITNLIKKSDALSVNKDSQQNIAKMAAIKVEGKIPVIYSVNPKYYALAYRWKCQFNENAKYPAFVNTFPEMNHNEIEGWEENNLNRNLIPIFLTEFKEEKKYKERLEVFKQLLEKKDFQYLEYYMEGESIIEKLFSLIYLGDIASYYLAILQGVNPTAIDYINYLKQNI